MDFTRSISCPDVNARNEKQATKLYVKALANQIVRFQADHQSKVNKIKGL